MKKQLTGRSMFLFCLGDFSRAIFNGLTATYLMYIFIPQSTSSLPLLLPYGALVGGVGWLVYELAVLLGADSTTASLLAVIPLTLLTRVLAILLKAPVTVFLLTGIFPLVPGAGIYYTAYYFIQNNNALALSNGISTFKIAVVLATGIALVLGIPLPHRRR